MQKKIRPVMQENNGEKTLILLETEAHVRDCLTWIDNVIGERTIIALTPFAMYELDKKNIHYKIIEEYYASEELYKLGIDNFDKVEKLCTVIDNFIKNRNEKLNEYCINTALNTFYCLKIIYDAITIKLFQLNKLIDCEIPDIIILYDGKKYPFGAIDNSQYLFFDYRESIYSQLLSLDGWRARIIKKSYICESPDESIIKVKEDSFDLIRKLKKLFVMDSRIYNLSMVIKKKGFLGGLQYIKNILQIRTNTPIVIFGGGYNWDDCLLHLQNSGITPIYRMPENFHFLNKSLRSNSKKLSMIFENLKNENDFIALFKENNINFFPILEYRIQFLIEKLTLTCIFTYEHFFHFITNKKIKAVISSTFSTPEGHTIARAAHNAGIPVITWQHGGYGEMEHPILIYTELISSDAHFVFGDGVHKYLERPAKLNGTQLITIGSSSLDTIKNKKIIHNRSSKKTILYITSLILQTYSNISTFPPFEDNHFWNTQKSIINILGKYKHFNIIIKQHPTTMNKDTPIRAYVADKGFNNISFIKEEMSVVDLISIADDIVIDNPFTTLLQALTTSKPIFVYLGHVHYDEDACHMLGKRAIFSKDLNCFTDKLDKYLRTNIYEENVNNKEFLINFGMASLESSACERAIHELKKIINEFNSQR